MGDFLWHLWTSGCQFVGDAGIGGWAQVLWGCAIGIVIGWKLFGKGQSRPCEEVPSAEVPDPEPTTGALPTQWIPFAPPVEPDWMQEARQIAATAWNAPKSEEAE